MVIDIVTLTDEQYAAMSETQLLEVRNAQTRANALRAKARALLQKTKFKMIEHGVGRSTSREAYIAEETERINGQIDGIREELLFYLRFVVKPPEETTSPYPLDYSLTYEARAIAVRDFYMGTYENATERFAAFEADVYAKGYLGEEYAAMYAFFKELAKRES